MKAVYFILLAAAYCACVTNAKVQRPGFQPKNCMDESHEAFVACVKNSDTAETCLSNFERDIRVKCRKDPQKYLRVELNRVIDMVLKQCMMRPMDHMTGSFEKRKQDCFNEKEAFKAKIFRKQASGTTTPQPGSTSTNRYAEVDFDVQIRKQAPKAMTDTFRECMFSNNGNVQICESRAKEAWGNLRGKNPTARELQEGLREGMVTTVGELLSECITNHTSSAEALEQCLRSPRILEVCRDIRADRLPCTKEDLQESLRKKELAEISGLMKACMESTDDNAGKLRCKSDNTNEFKAVVAKLEGRDVSDVKDNEILRKIKQGARNAAGKLMDTCMETHGNMQVCKDKVHTAYVEASGSEVLEHELRREVEISIQNKVRTSMKTCMRIADGNLDKAKNCTTQVAMQSLREQQMFEMGAIPAAPSNSELQLLLMRSSAREAVDTRRDCSSDKNECDKYVKENIARVLGKTALSDFSIKMIEEKGSMYSALEDARNCAKARKQTQSASCTDPYSHHQKWRGDATSTSVDARVSKQIFKKRLLREGMKEIVQGCFKLEATTERDVCYQQSRNAFDEYARELEPNLQSISEREKANMEREAINELVSETYIECMKVATADQSAARLCKFDVDLLAVRLNPLLEVKNKVNVDKAIRAGHKNILSKVKDICSPDKTETEMIQCRHEAKAQALKAGLKAREYDKLRKAAVVDGVAEALVACMSSGNPNEECDDIGRKTFKRISGANENFYSQKQYPHEEHTLQEKVWKHASILAAGNRTVLFDKNNMLLTIQTNMRNCDPRVNNELTTQSLQFASEANRKSSRDSVIDTTARPILSCREVDGAASYTVVFKLKQGASSKEDIEALSDELASEAMGFRSKVSRRRLLQDTTAVETYASRDQVECAENDFECINSEATFNFVSKAGSDCSDGSCCGTGTAFRNGKCHPTYEGMVDACKASRGQWGWTCEATRECNN